MKTSEAFKAAKKILDRPGDNDDDLSYHSFICHCLDTVGQCASGNPVVKQARQIIQDRLGVQEANTLWYHDVYSYLRDVVGIPTIQLTFDNLQAYRHRWLDALIVEYQQKGD